MVRSHPPQQNFMNKQKIIIVDENDVPLGSKYRDEIDYTKDIYRWSGIWIENSQGEVLIAQRKLTKDKDPGKWGPAAAGTLEEGETYESNAHKEVQEELGITIDSFQLGLKQHSDTPRRYFGQWFLCKLDKPLHEFVIQEEEVEQIAWINKEVLIRDIKENSDKYAPSFVQGINGLVSQ